MKSRLEFEVETLRELLQSGIDAFDEIAKSSGGLTTYNHGWYDSRRDILKHLDRILKEVNE